VSSVLKPWVMAAPWKCQSILLSGLRGPDIRHAPRIKEVSRWLRKVSQNDADPSQSYMAPTALPQFDDLEKELEFSSCHFVHHLADALRVVAIYYESDAGALDLNPRLTRTYARRLHEYIADELFHFRPETDEQFIHRHRDRVEHA
jgi:hypothetical protein